MATRKTTKTKGELLKELTGTGQPERVSVAEGRDMLFEKFRANLKLLTSTETISMTDLSRQLGMKSGSRIFDLGYGRSRPSTEELIALSRHYKCSMDNLLQKTLKLTWED